MNIAQDTRPEAGRYYNADAYTEEQAINLTWWIAIVGLEDDPECEEIDLWAANAPEARELARTVMERDYVEGLMLTEVVVA